MRVVDVIANLKNHNFEIANYPLCGAEADVCLSALRRLDPVVPLRKVNPDGKMFVVCDQCGGSLPEGADYCPCCGTRVDWPGFFKASE